MESFIFKRNSVVLSPFLFVYLLFSRVKYISSAFVRLALETKSVIRAPFLLEFSIAFHVIRFFSST